MCGGIDDGLSDGVFPIGSDSGAMEIAEEIAENKHRVLIVGDDNAHGVTKVLAENFDVAVMDTKKTLRCGHVGAGYDHAMLGLIYSLSHYGDPFRPSPMRPRPNKVMKKCLLPSCLVLTKHNSGYCSKECKNKNQKIIKSTAPVL